MNDVEWLDIRDNGFGVAIGYSFSQVRRWLMKDNAPASIETRL